MIAVSSYRPFGEHPLIDQMQIEAKQTWEQVFDTIFYANTDSPLLDSQKTCFWKYGKLNEKPAIIFLAGIGDYTGDPFAVIVNADIKLDPKAKCLPELMEKHGAECGISRRITIGTNEFTDLGLDFFIATASIWRRIQNEFPPEYKLGCVLWDTSLLAWMVKNYPSKCVDLSPCRMVFHPQHEDRNDQSIEKVIGDTWINSVRWPKRCLGFTGPVNPVFERR